MGPNFRSTNLENFQNLNAHNFFCFLPVRLGILFKYGLQFEIHTLGAAVHFARGWGGRNGGSRQINTTRYVGKEEASSPARGLDFGSGPAIFCLRIREHLP